MKKILVILTLAILAPTFCVYAQNDNNTNNLTTPTQEEKQTRFQYLLSHRLKVPLDSSRYPVFIFRNPVVTSSNLSGPWYGSGTALVRDGKPIWVKTAAHCFTHDGVYYITVLIPDMTPSTWAIESVGPVVGSNDVVMAKVGVPTFIHGNSFPAGVRYEKSGIIGTLVENKVVQSEITGEKYNLVGSFKFSDSPALFLMDYSCTLAESGSEFKGGDETFILDRFLTLSDKDQKFLGLTPRKGFFTALVSAKDNWH